MPEAPKPLPGFPGGMVPIVGQIEGDGEVKPYRPEDRPTDTTRWEKHPTGLGRGDHRPGMPDSYTPPEVADRLARPAKPGRKGKRWWEQPEHLAQWGREDPEGD